MTIADKPMTDAEALKLRRTRLRAWSDDLFDEVTEIAKPRTPEGAASARRCVRAFDRLFISLWSAPKAPACRAPGTSTPNAPKRAPMAAPVPTPEPAARLQPEPEPVAEPDAATDAPQPAAQSETEPPATAAPALRRRRIRKAYGRPHRGGMCRASRRVSTSPARAFRQQALPTAPPPRGLLAA